MKIRVRKVSFKPEYEELSSYLLTDKYVDFHEKIIQGKVKDFFSDDFDEIQKVKIVFKLPTMLESYI